MKAYAGIDLHSSNNYIGIMDQDHKRLFGKRLPNSESTRGWLTTIRFVINQLNTVWHR